MGRSTYFVGIGSPIPSLTYSRKKVFYPSHVVFWFWFSAWFCEFVLHRHIYTQDIFIASLLLFSRRPERDFGSMVLQFCLSISISIDIDMSHWRIWWSPRLVIRCRLFRDYSIAEMDYSTYIWRGATSFYPSQHFLISMTDSHDSQ